MGISGRSTRTGLAVLTAAMLAVAGLSGIAAAADGAGGRYIVRFLDSATEAQVAAARARAVEAGARISYDYDDALSGFAGYLPSAVRDRLLADPEVAGVDRDEVVSLLAVQDVLNGGALDRIDEHGDNLDGRFRYEATGAGVRAYVIDTGIRADHAEFDGRVQAGKSFTSDDPRTDCADHGTHVASLLGGQDSGVAKDVELVPVQVIGCDSRAPPSKVIAGIDWMIADHADRPGPAVANISLGVPPGSRSLDEAVRNAIDAGITVVTAAGNDADGGCEQSPARVGAAITVGAVDSADTRASWSNFGDCVDLFAPGVNVRGASANSAGGHVYKSGTSMASPLVAGVAATYLQAAPKASPAGVRSVLIDASTRGVLHDLRSGSPNRLLYSRVPLGNRMPRVSDVRVSMPGEGATIGHNRIPVTVKWRSEDPDGDAIKFFRVQRSYNGGDSWKTVAKTDGDTHRVHVKVREDEKLRFRVRATDERGGDSANVRTRTIDLELRQQGRGDYRKRWRRDRGRHLSNDSARVAGKKDASLTFRFHGRKVRWVGATDDNMGKARVYLDGRRVDTVDLYSKQRHVRQVLFSDSFRPGKHTLRIVVTGRQDRRARNDKVGVDAFIVVD